MIHTTKATYTGPDGRSYSSVYELQAAYDVDDLPFQILSDQEWAEITDRAAAKATAIRLRQEQTL